LIALKTFFDEKKVHLFFELSLWCKAIFAVSEIAAGAATWFAPQQLFLTLVFWVTRDEFAEDPHDLVANFLLHTVQHLSVHTQKFAAIYLLGHGVVKLWLIIGLLRERLWYFPASIIVFGLFIAYQVYRYAFTHSVPLLLITTLDIVIIALTWHEYRYLRKEKPRNCSRSW
jgi:uncharacterized membrane protein